MPIQYSFDHPAGYHEEGSALAHVQRIWGDTIAPEWVTCLGYQFGPNGYIQVPTPMTSSQHRALYIDVIVMQHTWAKQT